MTVLQTCQALQHLAKAVLPEYSSQAGSVVPQPSGLVPILPIPSLVSMVVGYHHTPGSSHPTFGIYTPPLLSGIDCQACA